MILQSGKTRSRSPASWHRRAWTCCAGATTPEIWFAGSLINLAAALHQLERDREVVPLFDEALVVARHLDNTLISAVVLGNLAEIALDRGDYREAEAFLREAMTLQGSLGHAWGIPYSHLSLGAIACEQGELLRGLEHFSRLLRCGIGPRRCHICPRRLVGHGHPRDQGWGV